MSITDELRREAHGFSRYVYTAPQAEHLTAIADRIDAAHEKACEDAWNNGYEADYVGIEKWLTEHPQVMEHHGYVELPKDADNVPIRVGDKVTCGASVWEVTGLRLTGAAWGVCCTIFNDQGGCGTNVYPPSDLHHYHAPTVEDVLREFAGDIAEVLGGDDFKLDNHDELYNEYAAKLRLAGEDE